MGGTRLHTHTHTHTHTHIHTDIQTDGDYTKRVVETLRDHTLFRMWGDFDFQRIIINEQDSFTPPNVKLNKCLLLHSTFCGKSNNSCLRTKFTSSDITQERQKSQHLSLPDLLLLSLQGLRGELFAVFAQLASKNN